MLLQELKLENIRSYTRETVNFSEGSTLLSGDIGSGKSTILLSIEFALFGTSRPDLPAESLLRKGSTHASVELKLKLHNQEIIIKRNLKKEKNSIKQLPGHIIINNVRKELMPVEMKAEIISLLGYPEELVSKNKNHIFRYTIYTPQEEMKFILQENDETRLNVLRKIFNLDKYKIIRENLEIYLKQSRTEIAILKTKLEPFEEEKKKLETLNLEKGKIDQEIKNLEPLHQQLNKRLQEEKEETLQLENEHKVFLELKQQFNTYTALMKDKDVNVQKLRMKENVLKQEISQIVTEKDEQQVKKELEELEEKKNKFLERKAAVEQKLSYLQDSIRNLHGEIETAGKELTELEKKKETRHKLSEEVKKKNELEKKSEELENFLQKTNDLIIKNKTILFQSKELKEKISSMDNCPMCLQVVSRQHKEKILSSEKDKSFQAEKILEELQQKNKSIRKQKDLISSGIKDLSEKETVLQKIIMEIQQLENKSLELEKKKEKLRTLVKDNNLLVEEQKELAGNNTGELNRKILQLRDLSNLLSKRQFLEKNLRELQDNIKRELRQVEKLRSGIKNVETRIDEKNNLTEKIEEKKKIYEELSRKDKDLSIRLATLKTQNDDLLKQLQENKKVLEELNRKKAQLVRLKELYHWLQEYFLKLTHSIETQVMGNIHNHFNQIFQEWFAMLVDDENVHSRLDDSFTPIIVQNGYEILFSNLSGGEKTSAALAYRLALNKVINDVISDINTKDLLILDEPTDGFSTEQLDKVRDVLERLQLQQTIIVSHESKIESFVENVIRISKSGHESNVLG